MNDNILNFPSKMDDEIDKKDYVKDLSIHPDGDLNFLLKYKIDHMFDIVHQSPFSIPYVDLRAIMSDRYEKEEQRQQNAISYFYHFRDFFRKFGSGEIHAHQFDIINNTWKEEFIITDTSFSTFVERLNLWTYFTYTNNEELQCVVGFFGTDYNRKDAGRKMNIHDAIQWFEDSETISISDLPRGILSKIGEKIHDYRRSKITITIDHETD